MALNFEKELLVKELKKKKPKKVLVQLPEGVKQNALELVDIFKDLNIEVIFSGETAWGGCAIAVGEAKDVQADLIVHFGHAKFIDVDFPVIYIPIRDEMDLIPILKKSLKTLEKFKKIGFSYSIQHMHDLPKILDFYKQNKKQVVLSKKLGRVAYEGHITGCQYQGLKAIQDEVECFVILGNQFHSMGAVLAVDKPVFLIDVYNDEVRSMQGLKEKILKQRAISIQKLKDAQNIGIITETKLGQKFNSPKILLDKIKSQGKNVIVITMNEFGPDKLMNFYSIDAFIELACPRIAIDDFAKYPKPLLTLNEALVAFGIKTWDELLEKGFL
ncbi:MAG TPA: diphthamide biosynthesis enzyme Dph2 [Candidatus Pacearchaeota archaeon]|nr:diphthamide biosynthesis enzyme Dph2 [Candidatus Pacearchaeota archaeon]